MIMVGKLIVTLVWAFWMMAVSTAEGKPSDQPVVIIKAVSYTHLTLPTKA